MNPRPLVDRFSYKGFYAIRGLDGTWYISVRGFNYGQAKSEAEARQKIDEMVTQGLGN